MGVDRDKINTDEEYLKKHGAGQSDTLFLAAVNTSTGKISLINVPRDIMAYVKTYDENGKWMEFAHTLEQRKFSELVIIERDGSSRPIDKSIRFSSNTQKRTITTNIHIKSVFVIRK